jgi:hypothetical protein
MKLETSPPPGASRILVAGSSEILFDNQGSETSLVDLLAAELSAAVTERAWEVVPLVTYQRRNMPERCVRAVERENPDLVLLWLGGNPFSEETVSFAVYHRARRFYPLWARMVGGRLAGAAGESAGLAGFTYRIAQAAARSLVGRRAMIEPDEALAATLATIEALRGRWPLLCRLPFRDACRQPDQRESSRARVLAYNHAVREACRLASIPCITPSDELEAAGLPYRMAADELHADLPARRENARITARYILELLANQPDRGVRDQGLMPRSLHSAL